MSWGLLSGVSNVVGTGGVDVLITWFTLCMYKKFIAVSKQHE